MDLTKWGSRHKIDFDKHESALSGTHFLGPSTSHLLRIHCMRTWPYTNNAIVISENDVGSDSN